MTDGKERLTKVYLLARRAARDKQRMAMKGWIVEAERVEAWSLRKEGENLGLLAPEVGLPLLLFVAGAKLLPRRYRPQMVTIHYVRGSMSSSENDDKNFLFDHTEPTES